MKSIPNDLVNAVNRLSSSYDRDSGHDVARFMTYESRLQWRTAQRCRTCDHYGDDKATREVSEHAYNVFVRYLHIKNYQSLKKELSDEWK